MDGRTSECRPPEHPEHPRDLSQPDGQGSRLVLMFGYDVWNIHCGHTLWVVSLPHDCVSEVFSCRLSVVRHPCRYRHHEA